MKINAYRIGDEKNLNAITHNQIKRALSDIDTCLWIDIVQPSLDGLRDVLEPLNLHPLVFESCLEPETSAALAPYDKCLIIHFPVQQNYTLPIHFLSIIVTSNVIITVHTEAFNALEKLVLDYSTTMQFHTTGASAILYHIIDRLIDECMAFTSASRQRIDVLAEQMQRKSSPIQINELQALKRIVEHLSDTFEDQQLCLTRMQTVEMEALDFSDLAFHFRDSLAHLEYALTSVDRQQRHLSELHQYHLLTLQDRTNRRLKTLTILTAVFMPLTLIAGIYGMNFKHMPELSWPYAYPVVLFSMLTIASLLIWVFARKGWFD